MNQETLEEKKLFKIEEIKEFKNGKLGQGNIVRCLGNNAKANIEANDTYEKTLLGLTSKKGFYKFCIFSPLFEDPSLTPKHMPMFILF